MAATVPASAAPPFDAANFNPAESLLGADGIDRLVLTDEFDGVDELAHISSVATSDADRAIYVICPTGGFPAGTDTVPPAGCETIGSDTEGEAPPGVPFAFTPDEGYEFFWNIPSSFDEITRDFGSYHCTGAPTGAEPGGNCLLDVEPNVFIDDANDPPQDTTAAELFTWCMDLNSDGDCDDGGDSDVHDFDHPETVPNLTGPYAGGQLVVESRVSDPISTITLCIDTTADAQQEPNSCSISDSSTAAAAAAFARGIHQVTYPDNSEMAWFLHNLNNDGTGYCSGSDCLFDDHYVVSIPSQVEQTHLHNDEVLGNEDDDVDDTGDSEDDDFTACEDAGRVKTGDVATGDTEELVGCFFDQFADDDEDGNKDPSHSMDVPATFVVPAGWSFLTGDCPGGTRHDHDGDGDFEHCHLAGANSTNNNGTLIYVAYPSNTGQAGGANLQFCHDPEQGQAQNTTDPDHGCGDASTAESDSVNKNAEAEFDHAHLGFSEDVNPADPTTCEAPTASKNKTTEQPVSLTGCVHDFAHNGAAGVPVIWRITNGPGNFVSVEQVTDSNGTADAQVTAPNASEGQVTTVEFCTDFISGVSNGVCDAEDFGPFGPCPSCRAQVQITWTEDTTPPDDCIGTTGNDILIGTNQSDRCIGRAGNDRIVTKGAGDIGRGGPGQDTLRMGPGQDQGAGGGGTDLLAGGQGKDDMGGGPGAGDDLKGGSGNDTLIGGGGPSDSAQGGGGNDACQAEVVRGCED